MTILIIGIIAFALFVIALAYELRNNPPHEKADERYMCGRNDKPHAQLTEFDE